MTDQGHAITSRAERVELPEKVSPVVASGLRILEANPNPEALRELLAIQRDWEKWEARKAFERARVGLKRDLPTVLNRDKLVDFTSQRTGTRTTYRHTTLAAVMDAVTDPLTQHGFSISWIPATSEKGVSITCRLTHAEGHYEETTVTAPVDTSGSKSHAQGVASTMTLLQRHTLLALLGIATADMVDPLPADGAAPSKDKPNPERALKAMGALAKKGRAKDAAEAFLGKPIDQWTDADIDKLIPWSKERQPGQEG